MNILNKASIVLLLTITAVSGCKIDSPIYPDETTVTGTGGATSNERSARYTLNGIEYKFTKPYDGIFVNNGVVNNWVTLTSPDDAELDLMFEGNKPATYQLTKYPEAYYTNAAGVQYNVVRGELKVTSYTEVGAGNYFSGTFNFVAKNYNNPLDSVVITNGVIVNASNEF